MRNFCRAIHFKNVAGFIIATDGTAAFHGNTGVAANLHIDFDNLKGIGESCINVSVTLFDNGGFGCCLALEILWRVVGVNQNR